MTLTSLSMEPLHIPFKVSFKHHSAERRTTESVLVRAVIPGHTGLGEGCPRGYVTGEDVPACLAFFERHRGGLMGLDSLDAIRAWVGGHEAEIDAHPAAWCAIELALLDALAHHQKQPVEAVLGLAPLRPPFRYSAVLGDSELPVFRRQLLRYAVAGFRDFKLKISGDPVRDHPKLRLVSWIPGARVRLDANNLWTRPADVADYLAPLPRRPWALEEPLAALDFEGLAQLAKLTPVSLILDESFLGVRHLEAARSLGGQVILNLRVSKLGGLLRSLEIVRRARALGMTVIVGAHVGETSVLTRAALVVAQQCRGHLAAQEGAFGTRLLQQDLVARPLMFGFGGRLRVQ